MTDRYLDDCPYCGGQGNEDILTIRFLDGSGDQTGERMASDVIAENYRREEYVVLETELGVICEDCDGTGELDRSDEPDFVDMIDEREAEDKMQDAFFDEAELGRRS